MEAVFAVEPSRRRHGVPADGALVAAHVRRRRLHTLQLNVPDGQTGRDGTGRDGTGREG